PRSSEETQELRRLAGRDTVLEVRARHLVVAFETNGSDTDPRLGYRLARKRRRHDDQRDPPEFHRCAHCKTRPNRRKPVLGMQCARRPTRMPIESVGSKKTRVTSIGSRASFPPSV